MLGVAILNIDEGYNLIQTLVNGVGGALGFLLAIVLFAGIRERMELAQDTRAIEGFPHRADLFGTDVTGVPGIPGPGLTEERT